MKDHVTSLQPATVKPSVDLPTLDQHGQQNRPTLVYHHNTRRKGGQRKEIAEWQRRLPGRVYAYYWRRWSNRTFFLLNGDENVVCQLVAFAKRWHPHGESIHPEA